MPHLTDDLGQQVRHLCGSAASTWPPACTESPSASQPAGHSATNSDQAAARTSDAGALIPGAQATIRADHTCNRAANGKSSADSSGANGGKKSNTKALLFKLASVAIQVFLARELVLHLLNASLERSARRQTSIHRGWATEPITASEEEDHSRPRRARQEVVPGSSRHQNGKQADEAEECVRDYLLGRADMEVLHGLDATRVASALERLGTEELERLGAQDIRSTKRDVLQIAAEMRAQAQHSKDIQQDSLR